MVWLRPEDVGAKRSGLKYNGKTDKLFAIFIFQVLSLFCYFVAMPAADYAYAPLLSPIFATL
jgi:hypothetical protein